MSVTLTPELEALVQRKVQTGLYSYPGEVLREALQLLEERDRLNRLKAAIAVGDAQIARGESIPWTPDTMDRLKREAAENVRNGRPIKDEVKP